MSRPKNRRELDRRDWLKLGLAGLGSGVLGLNFLSGCSTEQDFDPGSDELVAAPTNSFYDAVIQVFFGGGPSQTDTFDPKPGSTSALFPTTINLGMNDKYGQPIRLGSVFPKIAAAVQGGTAGLGIIRSLVHSNGDHDAAELATQSFWRTIGPASRYPSIGSVMSYYFQGLTAINVPAVAIDGTCNDSKGNPISTALNGRTSGMSPVLTKPVTATRYDRRKRMLDSFNAGMSSRPDPVVQSHAAATQDAYKTTTTGTAAAAFDLTGKTLLPAADSSFSKRITLAQELVKAGVPYVALNLDGNDSHLTNKATITDRWGNNADPAIAQLATNLKATGKRVLVLMGGEFGRTPRISTDPAAAMDGRDHWFDGFSWGFLSINQPKFKTGAWGSTGPDGLFTQVSKNAGGLPGKLVDACELADFGAFIYRSLGFQVGSAGYNVPLISGMASPVDPANNSSALMSYFGLV
ncbi:MAG: DUF1501 domain-containing protein [Deltaproteobacteria bacterium]|nr:DUF1501 domain-containing protein [Deltaproteobacteria bacterium]